MIIKPTDTIVILSHYYKRADKAGGPPQQIRDYLLPKVKRLVYIEHPFPYADDHRSSFTIYEDGKIQRQFFTLPLYGPQWLFYCHDIVSTWSFFWQARVRLATCIALDNLNTCAVLPLQKLGIVKRLIYYTIDYTPQRFPNKILNRIYHFADQIACRYADTIWILHERMIESRAKAGIDPKKSAPSVVLPMGAYLNRIERLPIEKINRHELMFVGHLLEKQGLQLVIEALPDIIREVPDLKLTVIGQGEYGSKLKTLVEELKLNKHVEFKGFVEDHRDVEKMICQAAIGIATYLPEEGNYTYYTDPGKPKLYLGCGLPVVITDVPASAKFIAKEKAGILAVPNRESISKALVELLTNDRLYKEYRKNAIRISSEYDTETLIRHAIANTKL